MFTFVCKLHRVVNAIIAIDSNVRFTRQLTYMFNVQFSAKKRIVYIGLYAVRFCIPVEVVMVTMVVTVIINYNHKTCRN